MGVSTLKQFAYYVDIKLEKLVNECRMAATRERLANSELERVSNDMVTLGTNLTLAFDTARARDKIIKVNEMKILEMTTLIEMRKNPTNVHGTQKVDNDHIGRKSLDNELMIKSMLD